MKDWCKHRYGYVNFDDEYMYFTSTGNWSDVDDLGELNQNGYRSKSSFEKYKTLVFFILFSLGIVALFSIGMNRDIYVILIIIGSFLAVINYMSKSLSLKFKIPYSKIQSIELREQSADIVFHDFNGNEESHHFEGLYSKGIDIFTTISDSYIPKRKITNELDKDKWVV